MAGGLLSYALFAFSVLNFYKDDPTHMEFADRQEFNLKYLATLDAETPTKRTTVIDHLGPPDITEAKQVKNTVYQIMFYRTEQKKEDNFTTKDECTPLLFLDGLLIAWGSEAYSQYKSY